MKLVIAEKPSVGQAISKVLGATTRRDGYLEGNDYIVSWCIGHLVGLAAADGYDEKYAKWVKEDLPIVPEKWLCVTAPSTQKQFDVLKALLHDQRVDTVVCATDSGREGELIFRLVYKQANCTKPVKRLWISSLEESAIASGFANLHDGKDFDNLYQAALARSKADWLVGINATRLFSTLYGQTLNIGRVMSPTLAMIAQREATIASFQPKPFYTVQLAYEGMELTSPKLETKANADTLCQHGQNHKVVIAAVETKDKSEKPPKLYDLTTLQREANRIHGFTAQQTLSYTQSLYEKKLVTYPRTDSRFLTEDMVKSIPTVASTVAEFLNIPMESVALQVKQVVDNKKVSDHHAIIPTVKVKDQEFKALPLGEREILQLIAKRLLTALGTPYRYGETMVTAQWGNFQFTAKGKTVLDLGWRALETNQETTKDKPLPPLQSGDSFFAQPSIKEGKTTPPKHFTDDTILSSMENANNALEDDPRIGIGTPATRAGILEKLVKAGLAERKGDKKSKRFAITEKGSALISVLPEMIQSPILTAQWEEQLKAIERGEKSAVDFMDDITQMVESLVHSYAVVPGATTLFPSDKPSLGMCPRCGAEVVENPKGFCCINKPCGFAIWKNDRFFTAKRKSLTTQMVRDVLSKGSTKLTGCYSEKTGRNYDCTVMIEDTGEEFVKFRMEFGKKNKAINKRK